MDLLLNLLTGGTGNLAAYLAAHVLLCLFPRDALLTRFAGWTVLDHRIEDFDAPEPGTIKRFATLIARRPAATN